MASYFNVSGSIFAPVLCRWHMCVFQVVDEEHCQEKLEVPFNERPEMRPGEDEHRRLVGIFDHLLHSCAERSVKRIQPIEAGLAQEVGRLLRRSAMGFRPEL